MLNQSVVKGWLLPPFFYYVLINAVPSYATTVQPYFIFDSFSYSETVPIKSAVAGWRGNQFSAGERQWSWNWLEAGVKYGHWGLGLLQRYDYDLGFSEDAADLFWRATNKKELAQNKEYNLWLKANAFHSSGLRISFSDSLSPSSDYSVNYTVGIAYLHANYMLNGTVEGSATALTDSDYNYDAAVDYHYTKDLLFERDIEGPIGQGFAIDAELNFPLSSATLAKLQVRDLFSRIYWQDSPFTEGKASSSRKDYDEDGYVSFRPALSGFEGTDNRYTQRLEPRWYAKVSHFFSGAYAAVTQYRHQYGHGLYSLGAMYSSPTNTQYQLHYWPLNKALELNWQYHQLQLGLSADQITVSELKTFWLSFSYGLK